MHTFAVCQKARTASFFAPARGNTGEERLCTGKSKCGAYCGSCGLAGVRIAADTPSCAHLFSDSVFSRCAERPLSLRLQMRLPGHTGAGAIKKTHADTAWNREM